ncbi:hypothetical protein FUA23_11890 [Neolewinella aurantiaca]|uniref:Uncharacterized protein n=1 Tax=Neolewinella aurantiaca TaxID=2602767 RepID=A0A5C7FNQ3_9BACT|nr:hypothetical protein [Neolewinella aurantiaca]TXF89206.1 hypothetical protein FUA23_11890 [Neolewinella aurantiaca]
MNSFLLLQEQDHQVFVSKYEKEIRQSVESRLRTIHLIGDIFEHFFPVMADTMSVLAGGSIIDPEDSYLTIDEDDSSRLPPPTPGTPEGEDVIR